ncbi:transporter substrate-binding domain-containing protein [Streptomyces sp. NPDC020898]|uniref:transporter substrate-binding domain-containing protein n=1 Tax=Streptomyces sp. NPDC020898 TaxID=3365101 RepID=UPI00379E7B17
MRLATRLRLAAASLVVLTTTSCLGGDDSLNNTTDSSSPVPAPSSAPASAVAGPGGPAFPKVVDIGAKIDQPGFNEFDASSHEYSGFEEELASYLGKHLGFKPDFDDVLSREREQALVDGSVQLVIATYTITKPRLKEIDFVGPYLETRQGLLVRDDNTEIKSRKDTAGKQICTVNGSTSDPEADGSTPDPKKVNPLHKDADLVFEDDYRACVLQLRDDNVDAVWTDRVILYGFAQEYEDVRVVDKIKVGKIQRYGIGLPKHHKQQCDQLTEQLRKFLRDEWLSNFRERFPNIVEAEKEDYEPTYKPTEEDVTTYTRCTP